MLIQRTKIIGRLLWATRNESEAIIKLLLENLNVALPVEVGQGACWVSLKFTNSLLKGIWSISIQGIRLVKF